MAASIDKIKILTYNVGMLDIEICGFSLFSNPPYSKNRIAYMPGAIRNANADIVCLQECYLDTHANIICSSLEDLYPYHARKSSANWLKLHNGMLILSKWKITFQNLGTTYHPGCLLVTPNTCLKVTAISFVAVNPDFFLSGLQRGVVA